MRLGVDFLVLILFLELRQRRSIMWHFHLTVKRPKIAHFYRFGKGKTYKNKNNKSDVIMDYK